MKTSKKIVLSILVLAMMLASSAPAYAIGFDTEEIYESVFVVYSGNSLGSGFAIGENCIITNAHVISDPDDVQIRTYGGETKRAYVISMSEIIDIAVIGVPDAAFQALEIADLDAVRIGDDVYAIGAPNSLAFTLTKGVVSSKSRYVNRQRFIQTDAAINTGNSGGPLLNDLGQVIGVNSYKISDSEGIGLAIPIDVVVSYLETGEIELDENGNAGRIDIERPVPAPSAEPSQSSAPGPSRASFWTVIALAAGLTLSLALNITLLIMLALQKRKKTIVSVPPSERTDFDIELLD